MRKAIRQSEALADTSKALYLPELLMTWGMLSRRAQSHHCPALYPREFPANLYTVRRWHRSHLSTGRGNEIVNMRCCGEEVGLCSWCFFLHMNWRIWCSWSVPFTVLIMPPLSAYGPGIPLPPLNKHSVSVQPTLKCLWDWRSRFSTFCSAPL